MPTDKDIDLFIQKLITFISNPTKDAFDPMIIKMLLDKSDPITVKQQEHIDYMLRTQVSLETRKKCLQRLKDSFLPDSVFSLMFQHLNLNLD